MLDLIRAGVSRAKELLRGMSLVVVGLNHRTVPVELLERMAVAPDGLPKALADLRAASTSPRSCCSRRATAPRVYAHATLFHPAMQDVRDFLADTSGVDPDEFSDLLYAYSRRRGGRAPLRRAAGSTR
jgi:glutamyl-tRNA reductase